ncbi:MAG TPA: hypothetical protein VN255_04090 [Mycobacterium sp.]|nr:hypothetical protein [Mycobacterium sp.]
MTPKKICGLCGRDRGRHAFGCKNATKCPECGHVAVPGLGYCAVHHQQRIKEKYRSLSAPMKLSADTSTAPSGVVRALTIRTIRGRPVGDYR